MEGGKPTRLLSRLLNRLRPDNSLTVNCSLASTVMASSTSDVFTSTDGQSSRDVEPESPASETAEHVPATPTPSVNIDQRYGGQYFTPEQLPEFCDQLRHLVEVIRNIQAYANVTGEYPSELERRLEREARSVAALAAEARNARDVVVRARTQRRAVRAQRKQLVAHLASLRETEARELESALRLSDRKLYKTWEGLKDSHDAAVFEPLLDETRMKQAALEGLVRLIETRRAALARAQHTGLALPLPNTTGPLSDHDESNGHRVSTDASSRRGCKRRRREARSVPLSGQPSVHRAEPAPLTGIECRSRYRVGSAGAVPLASLELPALPVPPAPPLPLVPGRDHA